MRYLQTNIVAVRNVCLRWCGDGGEVEREHFSSRGANNWSTEFERTVYKSPISTHDK